MVTERRELCLHKRRSTLRDYLPHTVCSRLLLPAADSGTARHHATQRPQRWASVHCSEPQKAPEGTATENRPHCTGHTAQLRGHKCGQRRGRICDRRSHKTKRDQNDGSPDFKHPCSFLSLYLLSLLMFLRLNHSPVSSWIYCDWEYGLQVYSGTNISSSAT